MTITGLKSITLTRAEGLQEECYTAYAETWDEANYILAKWGHTAPSGGGYDKCDIKVEWADGETYSCRFDLHRTGERQETSNGSIDLACRILDFLSWLYCNPTRWKAFGTDGEQIEAYATYRDFDGLELNKNFKRLEAA